MLGVLYYTQTAVFHTVQATDGAILSPCLCVLCVWWDLQSKCRQVRFTKSSGVCSPHCMPYVEEA